MSFAESDARPQGHAGAGSSAVRNACLTFPLRSSKFVELGTGSTGMERCGRLPTAHSVSVRRE